MKQTLLVSSPFLPLGYLLKAVIFSITNDQSIKRTGTEVSFNKKTQMKSLGIKSV